jgi:hypothetical protein
MTDGRCEVLNFWREKVLIKMKRGDLSTSLNKFLEFTSPADLHIYRKSETAISSSPADSYIC